MLILACSARCCREMRRRASSSRISRRDLPALLVRKLLVGRQHRLPSDPPDSSGRTNHHKAAPDRRRTARRARHGDGRRPNNARSSRSRNAAPSPHNSGPGKASTGAMQMTTCDEIQISRPAAPVQSGGADLRSVSCAASPRFLLAIAAFFRELRAGRGRPRSAARPGRATRAPARCCSRATRRRLRRSAAARHRRRPHGVAGRPSAPASPRSSTTRRRTGSRRSTSIRCRRAARSTR